jgi:hypothetical protein
VSVRSACERLAKVGYTTVRYEWPDSRPPKIHVWSTHPENSNSITADVPQVAAALGVAPLTHERATLARGNPAEQFREAYKEALRRLRAVKSSTQAQQGMRAAFRRGCLHCLKDAMKKRGATPTDLQDADAILEWAIGAHHDVRKRPRPRTSKR